MVPRVVITGCGRSGTSYIATVLQRHGLDVRHEEIGADGIVDWKWAPFVDPAGIPIIQQIRHPLKVIASCSTFVPESWDYICRQADIPRDLGVLARGMRYWLEWNKLVSKKAHFRYRVEELSSALPVVCSFFSVEPNYEAMESVSKQQNTRSWKYAAITWSDLMAADRDLALRICRFAAECGYEDE